MDVAAEANDIGKAKISKIRDSLWSPKPRSARMVTRQPGGRTSDKRRRQVSSMSLR